MTSTTARDASRADVRLLRVLPAVTLLAVLTITASAEYELARTVLNQPAKIAWALPVAVDSYVLAALRARRDVGAALAVMAGALTASMAAHLSLVGLPVDARLPGTVTAPLATAIMTVLVVVAWRVHVLVDVAWSSASTPSPAPTPSLASTTSVAPTPSSSPTQSVVTPSVVHPSQSVAVASGDGDDDPTHVAVTVDAPNGAASHAPRPIEAAPRREPTQSGGLPSADAATLRHYVDLARRERPNAGELAVRRLLAADGWSASSHRIRLALKTTPSVLDTPVLDLPVSTTV
jgi:hypothetical protein